MTSSPENTRRRRLPAGPWWGRVLLPVAAVLLIDPWAAIPALLLGYGFDRALRMLPFADARWPREGLSREEKRILVITFAVMGRVAKADGRVSETEVAMAEMIMDELGLSKAGRKTAIDLFQRGKAADLPLRALLRRLRRVCRQHERRERFLIYQLRVACADGYPAPSQQSILRELCHVLNISPLRLEQLLQRRAGSSDRRTGPPRGLKPTVRNAYELLGLEETASEEEIRRAYRRAISRHHPDRMVASGMPEEEVRAAARRTYKVRAAFDEIRRIRGF